MHTKLETSRYAIMININCEKTQIRQKTLKKLHFPVIIMSTQQNIHEEEKFKEINQLTEQKRKTQNNDKTSFVPSAETHGNSERGARRLK